MGVAWVVAVVIRLLMNGGIALHVVCGLKEMIGTSLGWVWQW